MLDWLLGGFDYGDCLGLFDIVKLSNTVSIHGYMCISHIDCIDIYRMLLFCAVTVAVAAFVFTSDARRQFW